MADLGGNSEKMAENLPKLQSEWSEAIQAELLKITFGEICYVQHWAMQIFIYSALMTIKKVD